MSKILHIKTTDSIDEIKNKYLINKKATFIKIDELAPVPFGNEKSLLHIYFEKTYGVVFADIFWVHYGTSDQMLLQINSRYKAAQARNMNMQIICYIESLGFMQNCDEKLIEISKKLPDLIFSVGKAADFRDRNFVFMLNGVFVKLI